MLFIFALPVMQVILFCLAIGRDPTGLRLAIVNKEMNFENLSCPFSDDCSFTNLSCRYLSHLNKTIIKEYYETPEDALEAVRLGEAWGAIYFTENFTDALVARMALGRDADEETLDQSEIRVWLDMSSKLKVFSPVFIILFVSYRSANWFNAQSRFTIHLSRFCSTGFGQM